MKHLEVAGRGSESSTSWGAARGQRAGDRARSIAASVFCIACLTPAIGAAEDSVYAVNAYEIHWTETGYFPAYEPIEPRRRFTVYGEATVGADDNLFRLPDSASSNALGTGGKDDRFVFAGAGVEGNFKLSQQELRLNARADYYWFDRFSDLNRWVYGGDADFLYNIGAGRLTGDIGYSYARELPNFAEVQAFTTGDVTNQNGHASLNFKLLQRVVLHALGDVSEYEHDDPRLAYLDNRTVTGAGGIGLVGPEGGEIGAQYRVSRGDYPNGQPLTVPRGVVFIDNRYRETETSGIWSKPFDGRTYAYVRIGYTRREHDQLPQRDFQGTTGRGTFRYAPTAKIVLEFVGYREPQSIEDLSASYALAKGVSFGPSWAPRAKLVFQSVFLYEQREFAGNPGLIIAPATRQREDTTRIGRLIAGYRPTDLLSFVFTFEHGQRTANVAFAEYSYNHASLNVRASF